MEAHGPVQGALVLDLAPRLVAGLVVHPGHGRGVRDAVLEAQRDAGACYWVAVLAIGQRQAAVLVSTAPQSSDMVMRVASR